MREIGFIKKNDNMYGGMSGAICGERGDYFIIKLFYKFQRMIKKEHPTFENEIVWICKRNVVKVKVGDIVVVEGLIGKIESIGEVEGFIKFGTEHRIVKLSEIEIVGGLLKV